MINANTIGKFVGSTAKLAVDTTTNVAQSTASGAQSFWAGIVDGFKGDNAIKPEVIPAKRKSYARKPA